MRHFRLLAAGALAAAFSATSVAAQGVRGVVLRADTVPVAGAVVTLIDSTGATAATAVTDETGYFAVRAPRRGTWLLRTEAVGFTRVTSFPFTLGPTETLVRRVMLSNRTADLNTVQVRDRNACDIRPAEGTQVALLWDEARKALLAAQASAASAPPVAVDVDEIEYDSTFLRVRSATRTTTAGRADRGFRSDDPRALRSLGYSRRVDTVSTYFAPDARVLLSDEFAGTHCLRIVATDPTSVQRIGLGFQPVGLAAGKLDVAGTIWIDRRTYAIDRVEFRYEPLLSADFPDSTFGGRVQFTRLASGHLVVRDWVLRMPIYAEADDGRLARSGQTSQMLVRAERRETVAGVKLVRGVMRSFDAPPLPLPTVNAPPRRSAGAPSCSVTPPGMGDVHGEVKDARGRNAGGARVRVTWHQRVNMGGRAIFREQWVETNADGLGRYVLCALPLGSSLAVSASKEEARSFRQRLTLMSGQPAPALPIALTAAARAAAPSEGVIRGRITGLDSRPVPRAEVRILPGDSRVFTDSSGAFSVSGAEPGLREFFVRRVGFAPQMVAIEVAAGDTASITLQLEPNPQLLAPVTVEARISSLNLAGFEQRRQARVGGGTFIGPEQVRAREASTVAVLLRSFSQLRIETSQMTGDVRAYGRGGNSMTDTTAHDRCPVRIILDGALMAEPVSLTDLPSLKDIAAFEIYLAIGSVPPMYSFAMPECGLLVVWTRDGSEP